MLSDNRRMMYCNFSDSFALRTVLSDCVAIRQEQDEAEAGGDDEAHTSVH